MVRLSINLFLILLIFSSCEKNISIKLKSSSTDLVVDASIENGSYPQVYLSNSLSYFSKINPQVLASSFVHNASMTISNGSISKVDVKLSNIDKATYDFWRTMEYNYQSIGNPFSSPVQVISNISNGALGYFGGYGSQYTQLSIPQ
jgi:hypothetical protein